MLTVLSHDHKTTLPSPCIRLFIRFQHHLQYVVGFNAIHFVVCCVFHVHVMCTVGLDLFRVFLDNNENDYVGIVLYLHAKSNFFT